MRVVHKTYCHPSMVMLVFVKAILLRVRRQNVKRRGSKRRPAGRYKFVIYKNHPTLERVIAPNLQPEVPSYGPYYNHKVFAIVKHLTNGNKGKITMKVPEGMAVPPDALVADSPQAGKKVFKALNVLTDGAFKPDGTICVQSILDRSKRIGQ